MPRFLNTWTGEFEWHPDPSEVTYAILSHVWRNAKDGGEQSYDDVRRIQAAVEEGREKSQSPAPVAAKPTAYHEEGTIFAHPGLSDKIKGFCKVAREAGFRLAWNDACCIDKASSAELTEAINSMYEWYRLSDMCYVYLADVPDGDVPQEDESEFRESRWHGRGWTLQELIAPERIIFLTRTWSFLGTKIGLAKTLERITGVDFGILTGWTTLDSVSVARRMSWAAERKTTRVEDRAYSLLGIFGLHMSPIYGEGENAFLRLQEEIIRTIPDQSTFVWGDKCDLQLSDKGEWLLNDYHGGLEESRGLLASSPTSFFDCDNIEPIASSHLAEILDTQEGVVPPVHCIFTPEGVNMRLICLPLSEVPDIRKAFHARQPARDICPGCGVETVALLQCQKRCKMGTTAILGLPLSRSRRAGGGSNRRAFHIGNHTHDNTYSWSYHTVRLEIRVLMKVLKHVRPTVEDVTILRHYSGPSVPKSLQPTRSSAIPYLMFTALSILSYLKQTVFEISPYSMDALRTLGIDPSPLQVTHLEQEIILETTLAFHRDSRAGPIEDIALRLSIKNVSDRKAEANFSVGRVGVVGSGSGQSSIGAAAGASHHAVVSTPHISSRFLGLDYQNDSRTVIVFGVWDMGRRTIAYMEYTVQSEGMWGSQARLLQIALQHPFASFSAGDCPRPNLWVFIDLSEMFPYVSRTESGLDSPSSEQTGTGICERDSETSNGHDNVFPSCEYSPLPVFADQEHAVYASRDNFEALKEATWGTSSERSDNTALASAIALPGCGQAGPSDVPAEPQLGQKRPRETSPGAESLGGSNAKRICQGFLLAEDSSPQEHSNPRIPGSKTGQSCNDAGHEGRRDGSVTTADWTWSGNAGDGVTIVSEQDQNIQSSGKSEDSSTRRAVTTLPGLAKLDSVAREAESARSENTIHAVRDTVETLRRENDALRTQTSAMGAQIAGLEATNAETRAEMSELRAQMAQMLSLLNTLAASQGSNGTRDGLL
ncbi:hypothetical protein VTO73DRAFT_12143 [Trametes versicolor]